ncbi:MAG: DUF3224 domain-containing protein [Kangiellaceae bacterium]|nr:DUF3224 domain-containing protein [Kangiellaceae bacterium]
MNKVEGSFEVNLEPAQDEISAGRMLLDKTYSGSLSGTGKGQMLSMRSEVQGSAAYVAIEHFEGELEGKKGSFSLYHRGLMDKGASSLEVGIIPDSGQGELKGIKGQMDIIIEQGKHFYVFEYTFEQ